MGDLVKQWIEGGMDYSSGVALYEQIGKNKLLKQNFSRSNTISNHKKLEYELRKFLPAEVTIPKINLENIPETINVESIVEALVQQQESKQMDLIKKLPPEMLPTLLTANLKWKEACLLKLQLNNFPDEAESESLKIQLEIDAKIKENALYWKQIDYYLEHKILPKEPKSGFEELSPAKLVKRQQYHFQNISKLKGRIKENRKFLSTTDSVKLKSKLERTVAKQESELLKKESELQILNTLVNGKG